MSRTKPENLVDTATSETHMLQVAKSRRSETSWRKRHKDAVAIACELEAQLEVAIGLNGDKPFKAEQKFNRMCKGNSPGVAVVVPATDWHVEERIYKDATSGKNEFTLAIAEKRIKRFYSKVLELIEWQNALAPVKEIWHPLLGDLLTGHIHEDLVETNELSPTEACVFLQDMICEGIDLWLRETKLPIFIPTCVGNHGRTTTKKRIKTSCRNSYEWLLYTTMARHYANNKRVAWDVGTGYHNTQEIVGRKVRFHHGDGLRYQGGVGGITIPVNKSIAMWDKVDTCDFDIFGHWHTFLPHYPKWVSCGSLMGYSEYSVEIKAEFQHPTQTFIVLDREYGMTQATPIFLEKPKRRK